MLGVKWATVLFNLLSLASLACLLNSAALVVFGKGLHAFLFFAVVLFNLLGLLPVKQEILYEANTYRKPRERKAEFLSFSVLTDLYSEIFYSAFESLLNFKTVEKNKYMSCLLSGVFWCFSDVRKKNSLFPLEMTNFHIE